MTFTQTITNAFTQPTTPAEATSSQFVASKEEFLFIQQAFKEKARIKNITAVDILLYNVIRGKDLERGFTPITNPTKLSGGEDAYGGKRKFIESKRSLRWILESFVRGAAPGPLAVQYGLTRETCAKIIEILK